ncbi:MAG: helix-turn-helix domain-containing protein [Candidatus Limnocylindrales bacterium]
MTAREQRRIDVLGRWREGAIGVTEASALLGCSERTAWRLLARFRALGVESIVHGNRGRPSPRRLPAPTQRRIVELARTRYRGVNDSHLAELLAEDEAIVIGRSSLQRLLRGAGLGTTRKRRAPRYRSRRERMPQAGLLVQIDGSPHDWLEGRGPKLTLTGAIDDATGVIVGAIFRPTEDGLAYLTILEQMCRTMGCRPPSTAIARESSRQRTKAARSVMPGPMSGGPWPSSASPRCRRPLPRPRNGSSGCGAPAKIGSCPSSD